MQTPQCSKFGRKWEYKEIYMPCFVAFIFMYVIFSYVITKTQLVRLSLYLGPVAIYYHKYILKLETWLLVNYIYTICS